MVQQIYLQNKNRLHKFRENKLLSYQVVGERTVREFGTDMYISVFKIDKHQRCTV